MKLKHRFIFFTALSLSFIVLSNCSSIQKIFGIEDNTAPEITIQISDTNPKINTDVTLIAITTDPDEGASVEVTWEVTSGTLSKATGDTVTWTTPDDTMTVTIKATAQDDQNAKVTAEKIVNVGNAAPTINTFTTSASQVVIGNAVTLACTATDPEGSTELTYQFYAEGNAGRIVQSSTSANTAQWYSPEDITQAEAINVIVKVSDDIGFSSTDTLQVLVYSNYGSFWVIDKIHKSVTKYASNGLEILEASGSFTLPVAVESDVDELHGCFVADQGEDAVINVDFQGNSIATYTGISTVIDLALHHLTEKIWALSYSDNSITVIDVRTGITDKTIYGFQQPTMIKINQRTSDVWVVEKGNNRVIRIDASQGISALPDTISAQNTTLFETTFNGPEYLYVQDYYGGSLSNTVYIADYYDNEIERLSPSGNTYQKLSAVSSLATGPSMVSMLTLDLVNMILVVSESGNLELFEEQNTQNKYILSGNYNFIKPHVMRVNPLTGECWIADNGSNQLVKVKIASTTSYTLQRKIGGFLSIQDITMQDP